ncbi:hypothetical protein PybrP1_000145 [[Pythium] brassicae (nom. inval.)]|nr:hypothetical protein PybrP1_000145 [[Pythium] brassicae (nom. inval.)]
MDSADSKAFVDALYRKVLLAVKASNAIPSEDDDFHYHSRFSAPFASHVAARGATAEALVWQLTKAVTAKRSGDDDDDEEEEERDSALFEGPEPKAHITDVVDALLDDAAKQLELFQRGGAAASSSAPGLRPLENKPQGFGKKQSSSEQSDKTTTATATLAGSGSSASAAQRGGAKPQDQFAERIDNSDAPFVSKLREKVHALPGAAPAYDDEDALPLQQQQHPYYAEVKALKYAEWQLAAADAASAYKKVPVEQASYLWVNSDETLAEMVAALSQPAVRVLAVDLEHHSYRSYMGLVCLMQISTATEDFLVDTLALRAKLQVLNRVFCDPAKVKVLHGADMDILWLQRDLGLYIVNMFDTGQAARLLQYPRFSLAYLLKRHCGVDADKQYQLADWRARPLDANMVKYAREDTRYLLYIYDALKLELLAASDKTRASLLFETLQRSSALCLQVYEKPSAREDDCEALSDRLKSTVGLAELSPLQRRVFALLYFWRDRVARREDESTGYVLPNHALMKLAQAAPTKAEQLFRACNPVPALVRKFAHELTSQISAEKAKLAADDAKLVAAQRTDARGAAVAVKSTNTHWRATDDEDVEMTGVAMFASSSHMSEFAGWQSGKRSAKCMASADAASATGGLRASFTELPAATAPIATASVTEAAMLERVNQLVARIAFVVTEHDQPANAAAAVAAPAVVAPVPALSDALPPSIAETYQMGNRAKRRKVQQSGDATGAVAVPSGPLDATRAAGEEPADGKAAAATFQAFDYLAASAQVPSAAFDMADATRANQRPTGKKKRGAGAGGAGGGSYNPFVAIRGAAGGAGDNAAGEELSGGAKKAVKRMHHMPRSATFR